MAALLAAVIESCLVFRVCGLGCCSFFVRFWSVCFLFVHLCGGGSLFPSCSCLRGKEEGTLFVSVVVVGPPLSLLHCVFSLLSALKLTTCTTTAVWEVCAPWLL